LLEESVKLALAGSNSLGELALPDNLWLVEIDEGQINQVFNNLLINAVQAMPGGGKIGIEAENIVIEEGTDLTLPHGKYVKLAITDQGTGIPGKYLDKIFDPYFTTKQKGSGLGLATAYSIIRNHAGLIKVKSQLEGGTIFEIYLPAKDGETLPSYEIPATPMTGQGKVLVMDDDGNIRDVLCRMLSRLGYETDSASDGAQAIEKFIEAMESGKTFDAVILDLTVPGGMGGKETIENLLRIDPQVKAIVSSGYSDDPVMANYQKFGFSGVIPKPHRVVELGRLLHRVINKPVS
jgi:CheY-like chemotaxis protein